jgi:hypothetical protein
MKGTKNMKMSSLFRGVAAATLLAGGGSAFAADLPSMAAAPSPLLSSDNFFGRLYHAYADEWGKDAPIPDPNALPSRRGTDQIAPQPETVPPYPFTEWPFGGASPVGASIPNAADTPLQSAIAPTSSAAGKWLYDNHIQVYGWITAGANVSTANVYGGNAPAAYSYNPNMAQLDQAVAYIERVPDTVQQSHWDWGFRVSGIYGETYRYTTAYGLFNNQYDVHNHFVGYDMPMVYSELYLPQFAEGLLIRLGRYISIPDTEAQLAPNNYMYSHSMTYALDNYTNDGLLFTLKYTKNWQFQAGVTVGTETEPWNSRIISVPGYTGKYDPGEQASGTASIQYMTDSGNDTFYGIINGYNKGNWGYNNLQWQGGTWYHKFNDQWHISYEVYYEYQRDVPNYAYQNTLNGGGNPYYGTAFAGLAQVPGSNPPFEAQCSSNPNVTKCTAGALGMVSYLNYKISSLDNLSLRMEYYDDYQGQRTGYKTRYFNQAIGWQHWFSPSIELRPEIAWYHSLDTAAFNNNPWNYNMGIPQPGAKHEDVIVSTDLTWHW